MKRLIFTLAIIGAGFCNHAVYAAAPAECFASAAAVFAAHSNASHASYSWRAKKSERCWYADAFNTEAKAKAKPAQHPAATAAQTSVSHTATTVSEESQARTRADASVSRRLTTSIASAPQPHISSVMPPAPRPMTQNPGGGSPAIQIAVNGQELRGFLPPDEAPADFESRFSASGYQAQK